MDSSSFIVRFLLKLWRFLFVRSLHGALYEITRLCRFLGLSNLSWTKTLKLFLDGFEYGPLVNRFTVLLLTPEGSKLYCPMREAWLYREIHCYKVYDRFFEPKKGFTVVDVGAHVGIYTLKAAAKVGKQGRVISVEPNPWAWQYIVANARMNSFDRNVVPVNVALADFEGRANLYLSGFLTCSLSPKYDKYIEVPVDTLDGLMKKLGLKKCDLLKLDVEGYELEILKGADNTLRSTSMVVVSAYHYAGEVETVRGLLKSKGFDTILSSKGHVYAWR